MEGNEWVVHFRSPHVWPRSDYVLSSAWLGLEASSCVGQLGPLEAISSRSRMGNLILSSFGLSSVQWMRTLLG